MVGRELCWRFTDRKLRVNSQAASHLSLCDLHLYMR